MVTGRKKGPEVWNGSDFHGLGVLTPLFIAGQRYCLTFKNTSVTGSFAMIELE